MYHLSFVNEQIEFFILSKKLMFVIDQLKKSKNKTPFNIVREIMSYLYSSGGSVVWYRGSHKSMLGANRGQRIWSSGEYILKQKIVLNYSKIPNQ